ncbi:Uncharacterized protein family UPF0016 [Rhodococcus tukisamuensis]|uniref:GDT1 family protein n=1 Tax=Rhodococcus tukisamuensis TaxID=168276 RepID=A0A1G6M2V9_9NOCA|nr:Uncharacterized protein family UPF0016 [Rhodococcus tukisamuensis]
MLATITLAADNDWVGVWIGSTIGMVAADALAIVGAVLGRHLPERFIQLAAATLFLVFGVMLLLDGLFPGSPAGPIAAGVILAVAAAAGGVHYVRSRRSVAVPTEGAREPLDS